MNVSYNFPTSRICMEKVASHMNTYLGSVLLVETPSNINAAWRKLWEQLWKKFPEQAVALLGI